jgi:hypothetical protein
VIQLITCLHPFDALVFRTILGLAGPDGPTAREVLFFSIPCNVLFIRNPPLVALYNARASAAATGQRSFRIALTALMSPLFVYMGWTGHLMGTVGADGSPSACKPSSRSRSRALRPRT